MHPIRCYNSPDILFNYYWGQRVSLPTFIQLTLNGLLIGGIYAAMTLGFSIIYGVMRILNLAHGEWLLIGAYVAWTLATPLKGAQLGVKNNQDVVISMLALIGLAVWLSLGFLLGYTILRQFIKKTTIRYLAAYTISAVGVAALWLAWSSTEMKAIDPMLSMFVAAIIGFGGGFLIQKVIYNRLIEQPYLTMLLVTYGTGLIFSNALLMVYSGNPLSIQLSTQLGTQILPGITLSPIRLIVCVVSGIIIIGMIVFLRYTDTGRAIRAAAQSKMAARLVGINIKETYALTFAIAIAATMAIGALFSGFLTLTPSLSYPYTLRAFTITVLGGLGRINGAVVGGFLLGLLESYVGGYINTGWQIAASFILLVIMLLVRPQGLLGGLRSATES